MNLESLIIHDNSRDFQPIHIFTFSHPSKYKYVDTYHTTSHSWYATIGEQGMEVIVQDLNTLKIRNKIQTNAEVMQVKFNRIKEIVTLVILNVDAVILV